MQTVDGGSGWPFRSAVRWTRQRWRWVAVGVAIAVVVAGVVVVVALPEGKDADLDCIDETVLPCMAQSVDLAVPVTGTSVTLTYSSGRHRVAAQSGVMRAWLDQVGLGGWTPDVVHRLDLEAGVLHFGDGISRSVQPVKLTDGEHRGRLAVADDGGVVHLFNEDGVHVETVDELDGRTILSMTYRDDGTLVEISPGDRQSLSISPGHNGEIILETSHERQTLLETDDSGHLVRLTDMAGAESSMDVNPDGLVTGFTLPDGGSYRFAYDDQARLVEERDPLGVITRWMRTSTDGGHSVTEVDGSGATTTWSVERFDGLRKVTITGPDGLSVQEKATRGRHTVAWPDGTEVDIHLSPDPRWDWQVPVPTAARLAVGGTDPLTMSSSVEVTGDAGDPFAAESIRESWDVGGDTYTQVWDRAERQITATTPAGRVERMRLDDSGRTVSHSFGDVEKSMRYEESGWLSSVGWNGEEGPQLHFAHDAEGISMRGPEGISQHHAVDDAGRITGSRVTPSGDVQIDRLDSGAVSTVTPEGGGEGYLTYTPDGRIESFALGGQTLRTWKYDASGRFAGVTDGAGREVTYSYDPQFKPSRIGTGADTLDLRWNASTGQLAAVDGEAVQLAIDYQGSVPVTESWAGAVQGSVERTLDDRLRIGEIAVGGTRLPVTYNADGLVTAVGDARIERDAQSGAIRRIAHANTVEVREYDALGHLSAATVEVSDQPVYRLDLTRDGLGRVVERREQVGKGETQTTVMQYDEFGQLTQVAVNGSITERYRYDQLGNRVRLQSEGPTPDSERDDAGRIVKEGAATFEYDNAGYLVTRADADGAVHLTYDAFGLLREVRKDGGPTVQYEHDGRGRRVAAKIDGQAHTGLLYLDEQRPVATVDADGVDGVFGYADGSLTPVTMAKGSEQYRIVADDTGSPRLVVDADTGEVVQHIEYEAFGQIIEDTAPEFQPFAFGGGIADPVSGLVRFGRRDYDPTSGRWTAPDPILYEGGDTNLYRYARNDPVNLTDPSGLQPSQSPREWMRLACDATMLAVDLLNAFYGAGVPGCLGVDYTSAAYPATEQVDVAGSVDEPDFYRSTRRRFPGARTRPIPGGTRIAVPSDYGRLPRYRWENRARDVLFHLSVDQRDYALATRIASGRRAVPFIPLPGGFALDFAVEYASWTSGMAEDAGDQIASLGEDLPDGEESLVGDRFVCGPPWRVVTAETSDLCDLPPPGDWSSIHGDPHIEMIDGLRFDLQAAGEFVYVDNPDIEIQVRFEGNVGQVTYLTAVAVRSGEHVIEVIYEDVQAESVGEAVSVRIDGSPRLIEDSGEVVPGMTVIPLRDGGSSSAKRKVYIGTDDGWLIAVENLHVSQNIGVAPPESPGETSGLFGSPNGDWSDDLMRRDGSTLAPDTLDTVAGLYGTYAAEWRVRPEERLFTDTPASKWLTDEMTAIPKDVVLSLGDLPPEDVRAARMICTEAGVPAGPELEDCTYDVAISGDEQWADQQSQSSSTRRIDTGGEERKPDDPLFIAANNCRLDELRALLTGGADVSIRREDDGWTALLFASQHDCPDIVSALLDAGADPATPNDNGFFPLYLAAQNGHTAVVRVLLDAGAAIGQVLPSGDTPLLIATFKGYPEVVEQLIGRGADPDIAREDGVTSAVAAAQEGELAILRTFIAAGADVNRATFDRLATPLHFAADGDLDIVSALIDAGADIDRQDARGNTPLHYAASNGAADVVRLLLASGADPDTRNARDLSPRDVASDSVRQLFPG